MGDYGEYFSAKKVKLNDQLNKSQLPTAVDCPNLFDGITIYINGYTDPPQPELREIFINHGGKYCQYLGRNTTFVIASNLPASKKKLIGCKTVRPEWITDSVKHRTKLDHRKYYLYNFNEESRQKTLTQTVQKLKEEADTTCLELDVLSSRIDDDNSSNSDAVDFTMTDNSSDQGNESSNNVPGIKSTTDVGFLNDFYKNSRLHLISTMKKETQQMVAKWRRDIGSHSFTLRKKFINEVSSLSNDRNETCNMDTVVFHVDLDCFFVAVGRLSRPHLIGKPVAVTHSKGIGQSSKSEIACASYEGRAKGIHAGMWLEAAKRLCPELQTIPYEFDEYRRVSKIFFEVVASLTLDIEPISCDELYINATSVLSEAETDPRTLANFLMKAIKEASGVQASIGIGENKLSARVATRLAKEAREGIRLISEDDLVEYVKRLPVEKLPGVGYSIAEKLSQLHNIHTCSELQLLSKDELKSNFGEKTGEKLYWLSRGVDNDQVHCDTLHHQAKSVSAGCSFGVRFTTMDEVNLFIKHVSSELVKRASESECYGKKVTLSLWVVKKGFINETAKPGGHGIVDIYNRTRVLHAQTREIDTIYKTAIELARGITGTTIPANYIRGVRISLDNLRYEYEMTEKEKKSSQQTLEYAFLKQSSSSKPSSSTTVEAISISETSEGDTDDVNLASFNKKLNDNGSSKAGPCLNGLRLIPDIIAFMERLIESDKAPNEHDVEVLHSFLEDLLEEDHVEECADFISYLFKTASKLETLGGTQNLLWALAFVRAMRKSEARIRLKGVMPKDQMF